MRFRRELARVVGFAWSDDEVGADDSQGVDAAVSVDVIDAHTGEVERVISVATGEGGFSGPPGDAACTCR